MVGRSKDCRPALKALDHVSREVRVTAATLSQWRDEFLAAGQAGLKSKPTTAANDERSGPLSHSATDCELGWAAPPRVATRAPSADEQTLGASDVRLSS
ncbi:MAG TPA: hypothetical protein VK550_11000, partial [Polyangiaceae bacterium]|nr:hypothetical protein [Polyangiaceae bacterium]